MSTHPSRLLTLWCLLFATTTFSVPLSRAEEKAENAEEPNEPLAGHSLHGEGFSEGPRQEATLLEGMPDVHFDVTTENELAQKFFDQGIGQLHGFWYFEAERTFRQVLKLDPSCAMAYWGIAMANVSNDDRAEEIIKKAAESKDSVSERERLYIEALSEFYVKKKEKGDDKKKRARDLVRAYENIVQKYPDDIEAKAFLVFQIWHNARGNPISSHLVVDLLARQVLEVNPKHPIQHYLIHLWDYEKVVNAVTAAARCGQTAPGIAHMWHMPGHTFSKLKRYADAAWQQEASARVDHGHMVRYRVMPDRTHNYTHNNGWLIDNYAYLGRIEDAVALATNMIELPRIPRSKNASDKPDQKWSTGGSSYQAGRKRLFQNLMAFELWDKTLELKDTPYLEGTDDPDEQMRRDHLLGMAFIGKGDKENAAKMVAALEGRLEKVKEARFEAADKAEAKAREEKKNEEETSKAMVDAMRAHSKKMDPIRQRITELEIHSLIADGETEKAKEKLNDAKEIPDERLSRIHLAVDDKEKAEEIAKKSAESSENQIRPLADYAHVLHRAGKDKEAKKQFEKLREVAAWSDLNLPAFERLRPLAESLGHGGDWRKKPEVATYAGERPPINSLGPLRWHPSPAPSWALQNAAGKTIQSAEFAGRPRVLIFYLGKGCVHCMAQLQEFTPFHQKYADADLPIVAIGTDSVEGLNQTYQAFEGVEAKNAKNPFPFPLLSDPDLTSFKAFRAHDDFENQPLHGTFLIDRNGLVRWQHISYEPFMLPEFLLEESQRLLNLPEELAAPPVAGKTSDDGATSVN